MAAILCLSACDGTTDGDGAPGTEQGAKAPAETETGRSDKLPVYTATGTIDVAHGGTREKYFTTFNTVPGQPGREAKRSGSPRPR